MARGLRNKRRIKNSKLKRHVVEHTIEKERIQKIKGVLDELLSGDYVPKFPKKNKFLYPDDEEAEIPQIEIKNKIDLRSEAIDCSGYLCQVNRRYTKLEKRQLNLPKTDRDYKEDVKDMIRQSRAKKLGFFHNSTLVNSNYVDRNIRILKKEEELLLKLKTQKRIRAKK